MTGLVPFLEPEKAARAAAYLRKDCGAGTADVVPGAIDGNLHFSPVESVTDSGEAEVYDLSVPTTHAFVANGIVNHNTVNLPETATIADVRRSTSRAGSSASRHWPSTAITARSGSRSQSPSGHRRRPSRPPRRTRSGRCGDGCPGSGRRR